MSSFAVPPGQSASYGGRSSAAPTAVSINTSEGAKRWSARFPVYQIDFQALASGKHFASTKRRVRWRFGFSNKDALEDGETGIACRGEEHDVTIVWSVTSGKRLVLSDGKEVHYSTNRTGVFEYSWTMKGNHVLKVIAHAAPALSAQPGFRQYDLLVDGQSFFNMPKVFELGLKGQSRNRQPSQSSGRAQYDLSRGQYVKAPRTPQEEEAELKRAIQASIDESRDHLSKSVPPEQNKPPATSHASYPNTPTGPSSGFDDGPQVMMNYSMPETTPAEPDLLGGLDQTTNQAPYTNAVSHVPDQFAAAPVAQPGYAPEPQSYDAYNQLQTYQAAPQDNPVPQNQNALQTYQAPGNQIVQTQNQNALQTYQAPGNQTVQTQNQNALQAYQAPGSQIVQSQNTLQGYQAPPVDNFAPNNNFAVAQYDSFNPAPQPTFNDISTEIMSSYQNGDNNQMVSPKSSSEQQIFAGSGQAIVSTEGNQNTDAPPAVDFSKMSINTNLPELENTPDEPKDAVGQAMKKLVNFDDISSPVEETALTMNPFSEEKKVTPKGKGNKSKGIPPTASTWFGPQPSLEQMKAVKVNRQVSQNDVMKSHEPQYNPNDPNANALVLHSSQGGNFGGGPPLLQKPVGFGLGAQLENGGYGATQQQGNNLQQYAAQAPSYRY